MGGVSTFQLKRVIFMTAIYMNASNVLIYTLEPSRCFLSLGLSLSLAQSPIQNSFSYICLHNANYFLTPGWLFSLSRY